MSAITVASISPVRDFWFGDENIVQAEGETSIESPLAWPFIEDNVMDSEDAALVGNQMMGIGLGFFTATDTGSSFIEPVHYAEIEIATGSILGKRQRVDEEEEDDLESLFSSPKRHRTAVPTPGSGLVPSYSYLINSIYTGRMEANVPDVVLSPLGPVGWPSRRHRRNPVVISPFAAPLADIDASTTQNSLLPGVRTLFDAADGVFQPFCIGLASPDLPRLAPLNF